MRNLFHRHCLGRGVWYTPAKELGARRAPLRIGFLILLTFLSSCVLGARFEKLGTVSSWNEGTVRMRGNGMFRVGKLSKSWRRTFPVTHSRAITFQHVRERATITISSWCGRAFDDASPQKLAEQLFDGLTNLHLGEGKLATLDAFPAWRVEGQGTVDDQSVAVDAVSIKANGCLIDLLYVVPQDLKRTSPSDFQNLIDAFDFIKKPEGLL